MSYDVPPSIVDRITDLERRLERVELSRRLPSSSVGTSGIEVLEGGSIRVVDTAGTDRVVAGALPDGSFGIVVATAAGAPAFQVSDTDEIPQTRLSPSYVLFGTTTETAGLNPVSGWTDLAIVTYRLWQSTARSFAEMASVGGTIEVRLWDSTAGEAVDGPETLDPGGTPLGVTLEGPIPYNASAPAGDPHTLAWQARAVGSTTDLVYHVGAGQFLFDLAP